MRPIAFAILDDLVRILLGSTPTGASQTISFHGLPPILLAIIPFAAGILLGTLIKRALKFVIALALIVAIALYLGVISWGALNSYLEMAYRNIPLAIQIAALLFTILPLGLGFVVGLLIGLLVG